MQALLERFVGIATIILILIGFASVTPASETVQNPKSYNQLSQEGTSSISTKERPLNALSQNISASTTEKTTKTAVSPIKKSLQNKVSLPTIESPIITSILPPITPPVNTNALDLNAKVRASLVNIFCTTSTGDALKAITGSGVIIDPRGVILTNAHLAQYYLLKDYAGPNSLTCVIRTGSPAKAAYTGELLYISPKWIEDNKDNITKENPLGTGENDFGLILITKNVDGTPATSTFPSLDTEISDSNVDRTNTVPHVVAAYPAGFLGGFLIENNLYIASAIATIKDVFTFKESTIDLISVGGSVVAQKGASGGAVVSSQTKKLVGIIVTTTDAQNTGDRDLRAITLSHINRSIQESTGQTLKEYLSGDLAQTLSLFNQTKFYPLSAILKSALN